MVEYVLKAMVGSSLTVTPVEAMIDTDTGKTICYRVVSEKNGTFICKNEGEWITPKKHEKFELFPTIAEAREYADARRKELREKMDEVKQFLVDMEYVFPGEMGILLRKVLNHATTE